MNRPGIRAGTSADVLALFLFLFDYITRRVIITKTNELAIMRCLSMLQGHFAGKAITNWQLQGASWN